MHRLSVRPALRCSTLQHGMPRGTVCQVTATAAVSQSTKTEAPARPLAQLVTRLLKAHSASLTAALVLADKPGGSIAYEQHAP